MTTTAPKSHILEKIRTYLLYHLSRSSIERSQGNNKIVKVCTSISELGSTLIESHSHMLSMKCMSYIGYAEY